MITQRLGNKKKRLLSCVTTAAVLLMMSAPLIGNTASAVRRNLQPTAKSEFSASSQPGGPGVGRITALASDPSATGVLYAGTAHAGIFKSIDAGANWFPINQGIDNTFHVYYVGQLVMDPTNSSTLYAAAGGLYKTTDGGATWIELDTSSVGNGILYSLDVDALGTIYAGISYAGVAKSTDGGATWSLINSGLTGTDFVFPLAADRINQGTVYAGTGDGLFKTIDGGSSWSKALSGVYPVSIVFDSSNSDTLYVADAGSDPNTVYSTTDGGATWSNSNLGLSGYQLRLAAGPNGSGIVYAGTSQGLFKGADKGATWSAIKTGLPAGRPLTPFVDPANPDSIYVIGVGVFKSADAGATWAGLNSGLPAARVISIASDTQRVYAGTDDGSIYTSGDGTTWSLTHLTSREDDVSSLVVDSSTSGTAYAATGDGVLKTADGGLNWVAASRFGRPVEAFALAMAPSSPRTLYATAGDVLLRTVDAGATWGETGSLPFRKATNVSVSALAVDPFRARTLYAGASGYINDNYVNGGVFKSLDGGDTWFVAGSGLFQAASVNALALTPSNKQTVYAASPVSGVFLSRNGGAKWRSTTTGMTDFNMSSLAIDPSGIVYAGAEGGMFKSSNGAESWSVVPLGLFNREVNALAVSPSNAAIVYVGTDVGVVRVTP